LWRVTAIIFKRISPMKVLLLIRHAKAAQDSPGTDFDRPLKRRGIKDARAMADRIRDKDLVPTRLISSPALRAAQTAREMAAVWAYPEGLIQWEQELYTDGSPAVCEALIREVEEGCGVLALVGHNPGMGWLADSLTDISVDRFPTAAIAAIDVALTSWKDFLKAEKLFRFLDFPA
jgi:phosphohistidine phosphatase